MLMGIIEMVSIFVNRRFSIACYKKAYNKAIVKIIAANSYST